MNLQVKTNSLKLIVFYSNQCSKAKHKSNEKWKWPYFTFIYQNFARND